MWAWCAGYIPECDALHSACWSVRGDDIVWIGDAVPCRGLGLRYGLARQKGGSISKAGLTLMVSAAFSLFSLNAADADLFTPSHGCSKPYRPFDGADEWQWQSLSE